MKAIPLADGLQSVLSLAAGSPLEHSGDSLSGAFNNSTEEQKLTQSLRQRSGQAYEALRTDYNQRATRNNRGVSHENGAIDGTERSYSF